MYVLKKLSKLLDYLFESLYDDKMINISKDFKMNGKTLILACTLAVFTLSGCVWQSRVNNIESVPQSEPCYGVECATDPFINSTQTRADYRKYGELSPRDSLISQAGAGNNISASIPSTIDNEVISYEEQIGTSGNVDEANKEASNTDQSNQTDTTVSDQNEAEEEIDPIQDWYAEEGQNLKALLTKWSEESGWRLVWNTNRNYVLNAGAMFRGRFADVSSALIRAFARARPAPIATFYEGNRVLVIETMEDENAYD